MILIAWKSHIVEYLVPTGLNFPLNKYQSQTSMKRIATSVINTVWTVDFIGDGIVPALWKSANKDLRTNFVYYACMCKSM